MFIGYTEKACKEDTDCASGDAARYSCDKAVGRCRNPLQRNGSYELATSNYLASGGSGFRVLQRNTTQFDTKIQQRDAATDFVRIGKPCGWQSTSSGGGLLTCTTDKDCAGLGDFVCACPEASEVAVASDVSPLSCKTKAGAACGSAGRCVLADCRNDVAAFHDGDDCKGTTGAARDKCRAAACSQAGEQCKLLACVDATIGAVVDGRQVMLGR